jgi:hypothetical protein
MELTWLLFCKHLKGFSPVWVRRCLLRALDWIKDFGHCKHLKGLSPVCDLRCHFSSVEVLKAFSHCKHSKGFSPVCVRRWSLRLSDLSKRLWTLQTFKRFFSCNCSQMIFESKWLSERLLTMWAFVRRLFCMSFEVTCPRKSFWRFCEHMIFVCGDSSVWKNISRRCCKTDALQMFQSRLRPLASGELHDQGDAKWIVIRGQLRGHNDTPVFVGFFVTFLNFSFLIGLVGFLLSFF